MTVVRGALVIDPLGVSRVETSSVWDFTAKSIYHTVEIADKNRALHTVVFDSDGDLVYADVDTVREILGTETMAQFVAPFDVAEDSADALALVTQHFWMNQTIGEG